MLSTFVFISEAVFCWLSINCWSIDSSLDSLAAGTELSPSSDIGFVPSSAQKVGSARSFGFDILAVLGLVCRLVVETVVLVLLTDVDSFDLVPCSAHSSVHQRSSLQLAVQGFVRSHS
ncbi:hypothetical protein F2Q69_00052617 [Brassica cretica]|uniref:CASP-like protein n=1 Tax=Brassica cretica TaxID=69181 RepID=A0A8S9MPH0_BRACR|nr:hypothetical protein F2Q69_00052617 [Brassica cretica]